MGNPANYPFATIDPEEAKVIVPSPRFDELCKLYNPKSAIPATVTVFDIAGLTKGASKGEGLGNSFLSHIRAVDGLYQMVRAFDGQEIIHIEGSVDPIRDLEIIAEELRFKDFEFVMKHMELIEKKNRSVAKTKTVKDEIAVCNKVIEMLDSGKRVANGTWTREEVEVINNMALLTAKPCTYLANVSEDDYVEYYMSGKDISCIPRLKSIQEWIDVHSPGDVLLPVSVNLEERLNNMENEEERSEELELLEVPSAIPDAIIQLRKSLDLISFYTTGPDEVREWTIRKVSTQISPWPKTRP